MNTRINYIIRSTWIPFSDTFACGACHMTMIYLWGGSTIEDEWRMDAWSKGRAQRATNWRFEADRAVPSELWRLTAKQATAQTTAPPFDLSPQQGTVSSSLHLLAGAAYNIYSFSIKEGFMDFTQLLHHYHQMHLSPCAGCHDHR